MTEPQFNYDVRMVLTEKAPFIVTLLNEDTTEYNTYLVKNCVSMDELSRAFYIQGTNYKSKHFRKALFDPNNLYIVVDGLGRDRYIEKIKCRKLVKGERYRRLISITSNKR